MHKRDPSRSINDTGMARAFRTDDGEHDLAPHFEQAALTMVVKQEIVPSPLGYCTYFGCKATITHGFQVKVVPSTRPVLDPPSLP